MPSDDPADVRDDESHEISRKEYETVSGDEIEMNVTESDEMEADIIELSDDAEVEIVRETIDLTGGGHQGSEVETVEEVIDLTDDSQEEQEASDATTPDRDQEDMEVEEVHNILNMPQLNVEDHLDEAQLAIVHDIINEDMNEKEAPTGHVTVQPNITLRRPRQHRKCEHGGHCTCRRCNR